MARGERSKDQVGISISLSRALLEEIDELAKNETRSRSNWIVYQLTKVVEKKLAEKRISILPPAAVEGPSSISTRAAELPSGEYRAKKPSSEKS